MIRPASPPCAHRARSANRMTDEAFRAVTADDLTMPAGWSVSAGQTFLYTRVCRGGGPDVVRLEPQRTVSARRQSGRQDPQGAGRPAGRAARPVRAGPQREDCSRARAHDPPSLLLRADRVLD